MSKHDYTAKDALALLIQKIETSSPDLAKRIRLAIDEGKDEENIMPETGRRKPNKRYYRKHVAYTDEEALDVSMTVLESHLIENRMLVNAAHGEFKLVGLASPKKLKPFGQTDTQMQASLPPDIEVMNEIGEIFSFEPKKIMSQTSLPLDIEVTNEVSEVFSVGEPKIITIESELETVQEKKNLPDLRFEPVGEEQLKTLREFFEALKKLTNFQEMHHGKPH